VAAFIALLLLSVADVDVLDDATGVFLLSFRSKLSFIVRDDEEEEEEEEEEEDCFECGGGASRVMVRISSESKEHISSA
jgi:hypothetical protein